MSNDKISSLLSLSTAIIIIVASFFQWWSITYNGQMKTRKWVKAIFVICLMLLLGAIYFLFSPNSSSLYFNMGNFSIEPLANVSQIIMVAIAIIGLSLTYKAGIFDRNPQVLASGVFIISKDGKTNEKRDIEIQKGELHTLQLINVGRGLARNVIPSKDNNLNGELLEDVCPHSYNLPAGKSTRSIGEILRVYGQLFGNKNEAVFYIKYEDYEGRSYKTEVKIYKVQKGDGEIEKLIRIEGIEIWKVKENIYKKL